MLRQEFASMYEGKQVLVAGGTGMIGVPLIQDPIKSWVLMLRWFLLEQEEYARGLLGLF